jgi:hypothetical protein
VQIRYTTVPGNIGRPARFRPGNDRFGDGHDAVSPLAFLSARWAHGGGEGVDPTVFPTNGVHPCFVCVPARLSKGNSDNTFPATRPGPGNSRWRPDKGK